MEYKEIHPESMLIPTLQNCKDLVNENNSPFVMFTDAINGHNIYTFNYRYADINAFTKKYSRNLRGIGFDENGNILYLPLWKFFNYGENIFTDESLIKSWGEPKYITEKVDGSLIIFFMYNNELYCRTQNSMSSSQAIKAMNLVNNNPKLKDNIIDIIKRDYTPLFEYVAPDNNIVVNYSKEELVFIGARNMLNGFFITANRAPFILFDYKNIGTRHIEYYNTTFENILEICKNSTENKEGYVLVYPNNEMVKMKLEQYFELHKIKGNGNINEDIIAESVINNTIDDIKGRLALNMEANSELYNTVCEIEKAILIKYYQYIKQADKFYNENKYLSKKDYAIKGKNELDIVVFPLAMNLFDKGHIDENKYKNNFLKHRLYC